VLPLGTGTLIDRAAEGESARPPRAVRGRLGSLLDRADESIADLIRERGGGARQIGRLRTGYGEWQVTTDSISDVAEFGDLLGIWGAYALPPAERRPGERFNELVFQFEENPVAVTAVPDDDTVIVAVRGATLPFVHDLTSTKPWNKIIGCGAIWLWRLTNQREYFDGCQIEFARPGRALGSPADVRGERALGAIAGPDRAPLEPVRTTGLSAPRRNCRTPRA
jgi:hypothetical protein